MPAHHVPVPLVHFRREPVQHSSLSISERSHPPGGARSVTRNRLQSPASSSRHSPLQLTCPLFHPVLSYRSPWVHPERSEERRVGKECRSRRVGKCGKNSGKIIEQ